MRLQLDSSAGPGGVTGSAPSGSAAHATQTGSSTSADSQDSSSVSGPSSLLNNLSAERSARIQQLTASVQSGSYQISSAAVSRAIVGHAI